jgi:hypothetical protein
MKTYAIHKIKTALNTGGLKITPNVFQISEGKDFGTLNCQHTMNLNRSTKPDLTTEPPLLGRCCYVQSFLDVLSKKVNLKMSPNNHKIYISGECPFCGEKGKRVFRYNSKLRVGKSYCCGVSFKDLSWLKMILDPSFNYDTHQMDNRHGWYNNWSDEKIEDYKKFIKDKLSMKESRFEKSKEEDENLPF